MTTDKKNSVKGVTKLQNEKGVETKVGWWQGRQKENRTQLRKRQRNRGREIEIYKQGDRERQLEIDKQGDREGD